MSIDKTKELAMNDQQLEQIMPRCRLACGVQAVEFGFSPDAGYDIHDGCIRDGFESWSEERFIDWVIEMQCLYGKASRTGVALITLYQKCNGIMRDYGQLV